MSDAAARLAGLGLTLPPVAQPLAAYVPAVKNGNYVYTSGQIPLADGKLQATGKIGDSLTVEEGAALAQTCALNALAAAADAAGGLDAIVRIVKVTVFVASAPSFTGQAQVANGAVSSSSRCSVRRASTPAARSGWRCSPSTRRSRSS
jgi:enamine deaminase RidA (YjgF/YER057c/UK114 family)